MTSTDSTNNPTNSSTSEHNTTAAKKPEALDEDTWEENQRWIKLIGAEAQSRRDQQDPALFRQSAKKKLLSPLAHLRKD